MKMPNHKTGLITGIVLTLASGGLIHAQQPANLDAVFRELGIMRNIFAGAMQQTGSNNLFGKGPAPDVLYLAGQGMVFSFNLPANDSFMYGFDEFCEGKCGPGNFSFNTGDVDPRVPAADPASPASPAAPAAPRNSVTQEQLREMNEMLREKNDALRDLRREMRALGRALGRTPDDENLEAQMATLETSLDEIETEVEQQAETYQQILEDVQNEREAAVNTRREAQIDQVLGILCDYGSTLKALPADEKVSLVFRNFTGDTDQVYVLSHAAVSDCTSADSLQATAISYQM